VKSLNHFYLGQVDSDYARAYPNREAADDSVLVSRRHVAGSREIFVIFDQVNGGNQTHRYVFIYDTFDEAVAKIRSLRDLRKNDPSIIKTSGVIRMWIHR
jgi:hypothetical protein